MSSGGGGYALDWALVQPVLAESHRVCSYDRANFGFSDLGPTPRTLAQEAFELHTALEEAGEQRPFVLVGHSLAGLVVRVFARDHPKGIIGAVLVDPTHENARLGYRGEFVRPRTLASGRQIPLPRRLHESPPVILKGDAAEQCRSAATTADLFGPYLKLPEAEQQMVLWILRNPNCFASTDDYFAEELAQLFRERAANPQPFGALPLIVIYGGAGSPPPGVDAPEWQREKLEEKTDLARLSSKGRLITDPLSGHFIHFDNPDLVIDTILEVVRRSVRDIKDPESHRR